jgi:hypothetical protein
VAVLGVGVGPSGEVVPASTAGGFRIRCDDLDPLFNKVVPILDTLGIAVANQEDDGRGIGRRIVAESLLPIGVDEPGLGDLVDVALERERDNVGLEPVDDSAGLLSRAPMRLINDYGFSSLGLPFLDKCLVDSVVEFAGWVVVWATVM